MAMCVDSMRIRSSRVRISSTSPRSACSEKSSGAADCAADGAALPDRQGSSGVPAGDPWSEPAAVFPAPPGPQGPCDRDDALRTCERDDGGSRSRGVLSRTVRVPRARVCPALLASPLLCEFGPPVPPEARSSSVSRSVSLMKASPDGSLSWLAYRRKSPSRPMSLPERGMH